MCGVGYRERWSFGLCIAIDQGSAVAPASPTGLLHMKGANAGWISRMFRRLLAFRISLPFHGAAVNGALNASRQVCGVPGVQATKSPPLWAGLLG